ncbi:STAS domain-containing protein [Streptomyces sp. NPDC047108]|uniref:STAS domain-containing protein n=1 Tax=Streptomyces sp. NPDC047108 TaxID=3155025 RepID=UPI0033EE087F
MAGPDDKPTVRTIVLALDGPITAAHVPWLCERLGVLLRGSDAETVTLDVGPLVAPDTLALETLARLQLTARRLGRRIRIRHAGDELRCLLAASGLDGVLPVCPGLRVEPGRQTEEREQAGGVQE